jgi:hypothetical protein
VRPHASNTATTMVPPTAITFFWWVRSHSIAFPAMSWNSSGFFSCLRSTFSATLPPGELPYLPERPREVNRVVRWVP